MPVQEYSIASPARAAVLKTLKKTKRDKAKGKWKKKQKYEHRYLYQNYQHQVSHKTQEDVEDHTLCQ